MSLTEFE